MRKIWFAVLLLLGAGLTTSANAAMPDPPGQVAPGETPVHAAYLFAHMTHADYGGLYYSVSTDGLHWRRLNEGERIAQDYHGHASICRGHDGRYYLAGNRSDGAPDINFWVSDDLHTWQKYSDYSPDLTAVPNYPTALKRIGAPKLYYDSPSKQYVLTWHTPHKMEVNDMPEPYWASQRTLFVTSVDLKTFTGPPRRLFTWDRATIDTVLCKEGDTYYALIKDEMYPTLKHRQGKTIRICSSEELLGPYSEPGEPISPSFREAPTLIPSPNGQAWYLYYEQYPGISYGLSVTDKLSEPWLQVSGYTHFADWDRYSLPPRVRYGCMLAISQAEYDALVKKFGVE